MRREGQQTESDHRRAHEERRPSQNMERELVDGLAKRGAEDQGHRVSDEQREGRSHGAAAVTLSPTIFGFSRAATEALDVALRRAPDLDVLKECFWRARSPVQAPILIRI